MRGAPTLDLVICNYPAIVYCVSLLRGMSDHCTLVSELNLCTVRKPPQFRNKHGMYDQGSYDGISDQLEAYFPTISNTAEKDYIEFICKVFYQKMSELMDTFFFHLKL